MSIVRIQKREHPFVIIDKRPLNDPTLSWKTKGLLAYLLSKPDDWTIRLEQIVGASADGVDAVRSAFQELKSAGYARLETRVGTGTHWIIFEQPLLLPDKPLYATDVGKTPTSAETLRLDYTDVGKTRASGKSDPTNNEKNTKNKKRNKKSGWVHNRARIQNDDTAIRIAAIHGRKPHTAWSDDEVEAYDAICPVAEEDVANVERFYKWALGKELQRPPYPRTTLLTTLHHWAGESDKSRQWCAKYPIRKRVARQAIEPNISEAESTAIREKQLKGLREFRHQRKFPIESKNETNNDN